MVEKKNIGFVSTRIAGTDGVSLEAKKWVEVLEPDGHTCYQFAGELDCAPESFGNGLIEAMYYKKPILVNRYAIYQTDIAPKGFRAIEIDELVTEDALTALRELLSNNEVRDYIGRSQL